jgi:hypothetical protein
LARRPVQFLLIVALLYWASGLGYFVHERMEHEPPALCAISVADLSKQSFSGPSHSPDDCPVCQALATMRSDQPVVAVVPIATFEPIGSVVPPVCHVPAHQTLLTIRSRGPPILPA